ncbi:MAG: aromatic ring-hydroxylating dioxygenase subunit alpha [Alphaproteobacteria bacterium]|nr:MAG: aromatic ring-hydroxylating dioxygenase subunit alpha [Alphaproteobacteria bacterium]
MFSSDFIRNAWYVAGLSEDFGRNLTPLTLLGEPVVIYRREDGSPAALEDACPHRKLPLSMGRLEGDRVVCGYHGLTFDGAGRCVAAPTQPDAIPRRAALRSYAVADRYGFLWIFMGDRAAADPADIIDIPHFGDPAWAATPRGRMEVAANYLWIVDNLLDPSHVAWVHLTSFAGAGTDNAPLDIEELEDGVIVSRWIADQPAPAYYRDIFGLTANQDRKQHYECRLPAIAINRSIYTPAGTGGRDEGLPPEALINNSYNFMTPVDADRSLYFWFQHRNQLAGDEEVSRRMFEGAKMAFEEDRLVLEAVHRGMKNPRTPPVNLGLDAGAMRFRRLVERRVAAERGG